MVRALRTVLVQLLLVCVLATPCVADTVDDSGSGTLRPMNEPRPVPEPPIYTTDYLFSMTRGVSDSTIAPAGKAPLFLLTVPLDIVFLPFTAIAGFFPPGSGGLP